MGMLSDGMAFLAATRSAVDGEPVTYRRRGKADIPVTAVRGRAVHQAFAIADGRANLTAVPQDWLILPAQIDFGAGAVDPQDGDRIETAAGEVYEVGPRDGEPAWRKADEYGKMLRLRTVRES